MIFSLISHDPTLSSLLSSARETLPLPAFPIAAVRLRLSPALELQPRGTPGFAGSAGSCLRRGRSQASSFSLLHAAAEHVWREESLRFYFSHHRRLPSSIPHWPPLGFARDTFSPDGFRAR